MASPVLIFLGLLFLVIGIVYFFFQVPKLRRELERRTEQTTAIISRGKYVHKRRGGSYYLYDLDYTVSGQDYGLKKVKSHSHFAEGDELSVSFNPDDPSDAHIDKFHTDPETGKKVSYIFLIAGGACLLIGIIILMAAR